MNRERQRAAFTSAASEGSGRTLPAATAAILCFRAALPRDAGNALQGAVTAVTLSFGASKQAAAQ